MLRKEKNNIVTRDFPPLYNHLIRESHKVTYAPPPIFLRAPPDRATAAVLFIVVVVDDDDDGFTRRDNVRAILEVVAANMMVGLKK